MKNINNSNVIYKSKAKNVHQYQHNNSKEDTQVDLGKINQLLLEIKKEADKIKSNY